MTKRPRRLALLALATGCALAFGLPAHADDSAPPPPPPGHGPGQHGGPGGRFDPERRLAHLTEALGLSAEQQTQLRTIIAAQAEAMKRISESGLTGDERREAMRAAREADRAEILAVLTPEQRQKFAELRPQGPGRRGGPDGAPPPPPEAP